VIAEEFGVPVAEVEGYHAMGIGYGILAQFYSIANGRCGGTTTYTVAQLVAMKQSGMGMGEIRKQALGTASAKDCNLGRLKQGDLDEADAQDKEKNKDQGKDKDKNKDKSAPAPAAKPKPNKPVAPAQPPKKAQPPKQPKQPKKQQPKQPKQEKPKEQKKGNDGGGKGKK
jgi:hypothetical protein